MNCSHRREFDVDHVVPLRGKTVSGLRNLQILLHTTNIKKHNRFSDESTDLLDRAHRAARNSIIGKKFGAYAPVSEKPAYEIIPLGGASPNNEQRPPA